jgi:hypothetical protein
MKFTVHYKQQKVIDRVTFPDAPLFNISMLAEQLGVSRSMAHYMLKTGDVHPKHFPRLKEINLRDVIGTRRPRAYKKGDNGK